MHVCQNHASNELMFGLFYRSLTDHMSEVFLQFLSFKNLQKRHIYLLLSSRSSIRVILCEMRATCRLLQSCRITLFTRENCGLCGQARSVLSDVWDARPFKFHEIDIIKSDSKPSWRDLYEFDVPVIHISKSSMPMEHPQYASKAVKLMHRFTPDEVKAKMDLIEEA
ncbi:hypothetical protein GGR52DRAFT_457912 [Hypoxylon sp. FL1284]|nr:hypothetical protein GGR52DRAFT_457912 [Hypoxylon sp. FL1284]